MALQAHIDQLLARALKNEPCPWPGEWDPDNMTQPLVERASYHGLAGLLVEEPATLGDWPEAAINSLKDQARGQAMWELRHRLVLADALAALARASIRALVLKGTALAYDLYPEAALRTRGDTDLLISRNDLDAARSILNQCGFARQGPNAASSDDLDLQEVWSIISADGLRHDIDLHWQAMNSPALEGILTIEECLEDAQPLDRLCASALSMGRVNALLHACLHRATHVVSPYFVDGVTHYGGDRLIWAYDIHLLASSLSAEQWQQVLDRCRDKGIAAVCLDGLSAARASFGTAIPPALLDALAATPSGAAETYLLTSKQFGRSARNLMAVPGMRRKLAYLAARLFPPRDFMRAKYPRMTRAPLPILYLRRMLELLLPRRSQNGP